MKMLQVWSVSMAIATGCFAFGDDLAKENRNRIMALQRMVMEQNERIDGLTSLLEGLSASVARLEESTKTKDDSRSKELIVSLEQTIEQIKRDYVTKEALERRLGQGHTTAKRSVPLQEETHISKTSPKPLSKYYSEGVRSFVKRRYDEAKNDFLITAEKGYKSAASNYYLGEIAYYTKHYDDAIFYYKKSAGLYDRASYMDVLLLHTAISLDKKGRKKQAKLFYESVINDYPGTKAAEIAQKRVERL